MRKRNIYIAAFILLAMLLFTACGVKKEQNFVQVGDMLFYYTGEPAISGEDDGSVEAILRETVIDYKGTDGDEKGLYFGITRPNNEFTTLAEFDAMVSQIQSNLGLADFTFSDAKVDGTKARKATVGFSGEVITFVGFVHKDVSYLVYASAPEDSADLVDGFIKKIVLT